MWLGAQGPSGFAPTGPAKAAFLLEAVADMRERLRAAGSELFVRRGRPEEARPITALAVDALYLLDCAPSPFLVHVSARVCHASKLVLQPSCQPWNIIARACIKN